MPMIACAAPRKTPAPSGVASGGSNSKPRRLGYTARQGGPGVAVQPVERKLAAIFAADIAGYSRLMSRDEVGTMARLKSCRAIIDDLIASHRGRIFNTAGDS